jgi:hypothetical protein
MTEAKLKWRVGEKPTGLYRSFAERAWPSAELPNGHIAAILEASEAYALRVAETTELRVRVADRSAGSTFVWRTLKARPVGVKAAKALVARFFEAHSEFLGLDYAKDISGDSL